MIGGLPEQTARKIAESIVFNLAVMVGAIVLVAILAAALLLVARRARGPWRRTLLVAGAISGLVAAVAFGLLLATL